MAPRTSEASPTARQRAPRTDPATRRAQLLEAGAQLIARDGYANVTVAEIAGAIGLVKAGFYYHFDTKRDLLAAIVIAAHRDGLEILDHLFVEGGTARDRVESYIREHASWIVRHSDRVEIIRREAAVLANTEAMDIAEFRRRFSDGLTQQIRLGQIEGDFDRGLNPRLAAHAILGMLNWLAQWQRVDRDLSEADIVDHIVRQALGGLTGLHEQRTPPEDTDGHV